MRNLIKKPCWESSDLGQPIPDNLHAVSVALPTWKDVINYEEKNKECINSLKSIYPRFGFNPLIKEIEQLAISKTSSKFTSAWPYSNFKLAEKAQEFCENKLQNQSTQIIEINGLSCLMVEEHASKLAKSFWQHSGLGASSREAAIALQKESKPSQEDAIAAKEKIKERLSILYQIPNEYIFLMPSGMASLYSALELIYGIFPKAKTLQIGFPYVDVLKLPQTIFEGAELILNTNSIDLEQKILEKKPSAIIVELPSNPLLKCVDLKSISLLSRKHKIPLIADDTIGSAFNLRSLNYVDIVFSSLTKSFSGSGDIMAGSLTLNPKSYFAKKFLNQIKSTYKAELSDAEAIALEKASRDIFSRLPNLNSACLELKRRLETHPNIKNIFHPEGCKNYESLMIQKDGYGCLFSIELKGGEDHAKNFFNTLQISKGPSLGTTFSLACPYVQLAHYKELEWAEKCGVPKNLIRISVGLEGINHLHEIFLNSLKN